MPSLRGYKRKGNKLLPHGTAKPETAQFMIMIKATRKTKQCHLIEYPFMSWRQLGNYEKPIREFFFFFCKLLLLGTELIFKNLQWPLV